MTSFGYRTGALLLGLATGASLLGGLALALTLPSDAQPVSAPGRAAAAPPPTLRSPTVPLAAVAMVPAQAPPAPTPAPKRASRSGAGGVVSAVNAERRRAGCGALSTDSRLTDSAQGHASDMAENGYFSHTGQGGGDFVDRAAAAGYPDPGGENIARGQDSAAEVVDAWMHSASHRDNILDCSFSTTGVGFDSRGDYWVQDFGR